MKRPHWDLALVKKLAATRHGLIMKKSRASQCFSSVPEAYRVCRAIIAELTVDSFSESVVQQFEEVFDVYGVIIDGVGFFLKFTVEVETRVIVISLYPLEKAAMKTNKGKVQP